MRYVDNLAEFTTKSSTSGFDQRFYFQPISLEQCPLQNIFLGCRITTDGPTTQCLYVVHDESWRYVSVQGAGSLSHKLSGLHSRMHAAFTLSFPFSNKKIAIRQLAKIYLNLGFDSKEINDVVHKFLPLETICN